MRNITYRNVLISMLLMGVAMLATSCYKLPHSTYQSPSLSYQYEEPKNYCRNVQKETGFELFCPEGRIEVEFVPYAVNENLADALTKLTYEFAGGKYLITEFALKDSKGLLAKSESVLQENGMLPPNYILAMAFDERRMIISRGFSYRPDIVSFETDFWQAYQSVISSLEPY